MKKIVLRLGILVIGLFVLSSCNNKENISEKPTVSTENTSKNIQDEANKKLVLDFYQRMFGDKDVTAVDDYILPSYIQHNPDVADGAEAFKKEAIIWFKDQPKTKIDVQHIAADGDLVFIHLKNVNPEGGLTSTIDIFRIEEGKIAEHWDVQQDVPKESANAHPMF